MPASAQTSSLNYLRQAISAVVIFAGLLGPVTASDTQIYVDPAGNDSHDGSRDQPLLSLAGARDAVRQRLAAGVREPIQVLFNPGVYPMSETVTFTSQDSAADGQRITYQAAKTNDKNDAEVIFTGAVTVSDWQLHDADANIYRASVPDVGFRQLYIDGKRGIRARIPNQEDEATGAPFWPVTLETVPVNLISRQHWEAAQTDNMAEVEMVLLTKFYQQNFHVGPHSIEGDQVAISPLKPEGKMSKKAWFYQHSQCYFENSLSYLDAPWEWYLDRQEDIVYLALPKNTKPADYSISIPQLDTLIAVEGTADEPVRNVTFQGLTLEGSNWDYPTEHGTNMTQFAQPIPLDDFGWENQAYPPGLIRAKHGRQIVFDSNIIRNAGAHGIQFYADMDESDIANNTIHAISGNGIEIDAHRLRNAPPEKLSSHVAIWNNHIHHVGRDYTSAGAILAHNVQYLIVEHNHIHDTPYSGIQVGNQPRTPETKGNKTFDIGCGNNRIRFNLVHDCLQLLVDGGGIYTLGGNQVGTVIEENYIHSITRSPFGWNKPNILYVYIDNSSSGITIRNNVLQPTAKEKARKNSLCQSWRGEPVA